MDAEKNFMNEFLCCFEMKRCLWDTASPEYMLRDVKNRAYKELLSIMQKYKKNCSMEDVKKKINTIRCSYRRELKKIKVSESFGAGVHNVYKPKIWWFDSCQFLRRSEQPIGSISTLSDEDTLHDTCSMDQADSSLNEQPKKKSKKDIKENEVVDMAMSYLQKESDGFEHLGLAWAAKLRKMQPRQCKIAERLISEVLFQGDLEMLTIDTAIVTKKTPMSTAASSSCTRSSTPVDNSADANAYSAPTFPQDVFSQTETIFLPSSQEPGTHIFNCKQE